MSSSNISCCCFVPHFNAAMNQHGDHEHDRVLYRRGPGHMQGPNTAQFVFGGEILRSAGINCNCEEQKIIPGSEPALTASLCLLDSACNAFKFMILRMK